MKQSIHTLDMSEKDIQKLVSIITREWWRVTFGIATMILIIILIINFMRNSFEWGTDDTDLSGRNRSGMHLFTDYGTGVQYLASPHGGITPRIDQDGNLIIWKGDDHE